MLVAHWISLVMAKWAGWGASQIGYGSNESCVHVKVGWGCIEPKYFSSTIIILKIVITICNNKDFNIII